MMVKLEHLVFIVQSILSELFILFYICTTDKLYKQASEYSRNSRILRQDVCVSQVLLR